MPRPKTFYLGALNFTIHPHNPQKYYDLIEETFSLNLKIPIRGDEYASIGTCWAINGDNILDGVYGDIFKFVQLDPNDDWFNIKNEKIATEAELKEINIPDHLKPHFSKFAYAFFPRNHRFVLVLNNDKNKNMSITLARRLFEKIFNNENLIEKYGEVSVSIEQSREELQKMLSLYKINHLSIKITRPNPDDNDTLDEEVIRRLLDEQNVNKAEFNYQAVRGQTITPNDETKKYARIAASNGSVEMTGKDIEENPIAISTEQFPLLSTFKYDANKNDFRQLSLTYAQQFVKSIIRKDI